jgi:hypothetical protein
MAFLVTQSLLIASQFLARHLKAIENAGVLIVFPVLRFASASKNIGRTISKTFDRFYAVFTKRNKHLRRYTWNMLDTVCKTKLLSVTIKIHHAVQCVYFCPFQRVSRSASYQNSAACLIAITCLVAPAFWQYSLRSAGPRRA